MAIDYRQANIAHRKLRAALTRAVNKRDRDAIVTACERAVTEWSRPPFDGAWPDDWARWQNALLDATRRGMASDWVSLREFADHVAERNARNLAAIAPSADTTPPSVSLTVAGVDVDASALARIVAERAPRHGDKWSADDLASHFAPYFANGVRLRVNTPDAFGRPGYTRTGRVGITTGWRPAFLLMHRSNAHGSWDVLSDRDVIVGIQTRRGGPYVPTSHAFRVFNYWRNAANA